MLTLFDTSVWIRHFKVPDQQLVTALEDGSALIHEAIIGELAVGRIPKPKSTLSDLLSLPFAPAVPFRELSELLQRRNLVSRGLSWIDVHLIGSALAADAELLSYDAPLAAVWRTVR